MKTISIFIIFILLFACSTNVPEPVEENLNISSFGTDGSFEIASWNIQNFPKHNKTFDLVKEIIESIDIDLIAVQEITSVSAFNQLVNSMPGWKGHLSSDSYSNGTYQKTGILYKSNFISVSSVRNIFNEDSDAFPRPPLTAFVEIKDYESTKYNFNIIVLHLKASGFGDEDDNIRRRREACQKLESYIAQEINNGADADFIILGDWNDELSDAVSENVFLPFLDKDSLYSFLTLDLNEPSYPSYNSLIDHIMITSDSHVEYNQGDISILKFEQDIPLYYEQVSDHRPVAIRFNGFTIKISP